VAAAHLPGQPAARLPVRLHRPVEGRRVSSHTWPAARRYVLPPLALGVPLALSGRRTGWALLGSLPPSSRSSATPNGRCRPTRTSCTPPRTAS
jgi:hypothetical protein